MVTSLYSVSLTGHVLHRYRSVWGTAAASCFGYEERTNILIMIALSIHARKTCNFPLRLWMTMMMMMIMTEELEAAVLICTQVDYTEQSLTYMKYFVFHWMQIRRFTTCCIPDVLKMILKDVCVNFVKLLQYRYCQQICAVTSNDVLGDVLTILFGVRQGGVLSQMRFSLYIHIADVIIDVKNVLRYLFWSRFLFCQRFLFFKKPLAK